MIKQPSVSTTTTSTSVIPKLPPTGIARVKSVLSSDTVILLGKPNTPNQTPPEVLFTIESIIAPRLASVKTPIDEGNAFPAREWLRQLIVGKMIRFETITPSNTKSSSTNTTTTNTTNDRIYGYLYLEPPYYETKLNIGIECVRLGHATPKSIKYGKSNTIDTTTSSNSTDTSIKENSAENNTDTTTNNNDYETLLLKAYKEAQESKRGIHSILPLVRHVKNAGDDYILSNLVTVCQNIANEKRILCVIEHCLDGNRFRCQITDTSIQLRDFIHSSFTLVLAGISCPRYGNPKADPPTSTEPFAVEAHNFVITRLLQREIPISLLGTDKNGFNAIGTIHHPAGNIAIELLKNGYGKMAEWTVRMMTPAEIPPLRIAENNAKRTGIGIWKSYVPPTLSSASQIRGTVVEVLSGDTILVLPNGKLYDSDNQVIKISLASIRAPRVGSTVAGRADEPYAIECKDRLRILTIGKVVDITVHYERDIPIRPGENEKRSFGTVSCGKHVDVGEILISEGFAVTQQHRDDDEKSIRYDELRAAEVIAKNAKKGLHNDTVEYKRKTINDLTDPRKAKAYSGSLMRAGTVKGIVDYVFNGSLFKLYIPNENCYIRFTPNYIRCPQPSAPNTATTSNNNTNKPATNVKAAEPFGDAAKYHARLNTLQRQVEVICTGVTNSGIILGSLYIGYGANRIDYTIDLLGTGLATLDQRKVDYNEVPKNLIDAQNIAKANKIGIWSLEQPKSEISTPSNEKYIEKVIQGRISEIRSGNHFFYHIINDKALSVIEDSMTVFTKNNGTSGSPCDVKVGRIVAALFDDGSGKKWYRGKVIEKKNPMKATILFVDYGNVATVPIATHLRPLDMTLHIDRIAPVAHEAILALTITRSIDNEYGIDAARMLQSKCWGKDLIINTFAPDENGKMAVSVSIAGNDQTMNVQLILEGLARAGKSNAIDHLISRMDTTKGDTTSTIVQFGKDLIAAEEVARKARSGMWRYGDIGDEDPDEI